MKIHGTTGSLASDGVLTPKELSELNESQLNDVRAVQAYWQQNGYEEPYPLVIKPTGYGKGRVIDALLHPNQEPGVALLIVGTKNILVEQNQEGLRSLVLEETGESRFSILPDTSGPVIVATWQSIEAYWKKFHTPPEIDLAIVDEAHNAGTKKRLRALKWLQPKKVVGLTATAYRASGDLRAPEHYGFQPIEEITDTLPACIERRWLSPLMGLCIDTEIVLPRDVMTGGTISGKKLYREMRHHPDLFAGIAQEISTRFLPSGMKTIVVVNRVLEEACVIYKHLENMGFTVGLAVNQSASRMLENSYVTNGSIERYKLPHDDPNSIQVLISPQVIGEGFDAPATECVVWASPTHSSLRYTQVMGRGARRCPGKAYCLVVDFVYMIEGYGYSMNFAQFFKRNEIKELEGGFMYVGPTDGSSPTIIPETFTRGGRVVAIANLDRPIVRDAGDWLVRGQMAKILGKSLSWVTSQLIGLAIEGEERLDCIGRPQLHYPPKTLEVLQAVISSLPDAGGWIPAANLASEVGKSQSWITSVLRQLGITSEKRVSPTRREYDYYPPNVVKILKEEANRYQPAGDWLTAFRIAERVGKTQKWVIPELKRLGIKPEQRWSSNGHLNSYYPPTAVDQLEKVISAAPTQGKYITIQKASDTLGVAKQRVKKILDELKIKGEDRWVQGQLRKHFSPQEIAQVKAALDSYPLQGNFLTLVELAREVGKSTCWCERNLKPLGVKTEERWTDNGFKTCYPPSTVTSLKELSTSVPESGDWLTADEISVAIGVSPRWVQPRLPAELAEKRLSKKKGVFTHYPPETIQMLKSELESIPAAGDWKTISGMATELGVAHNWVTARLGSYQDHCQVRRADDNRMFNHYPPHVLEDLRRQWNEYKKSRK